MLMFLATVAKAILAGVIAFLGSLVTVLVGNNSLGDLTDGQWAAAVLAGLVALAAVYGVPNRQSG